MGITRISGLVAFVFAVGLLGGCASSAPEEPELDREETEMETRPAPPVEMIEPEVVRPSPTVRGGDVYVLPDDDATALVRLNGIFYFDFDQAIVKRAGHEDLNGHANYLGAHRATNVRLEGHADERGTREYNLALGERRANAVKAYLTTQGASSSQIEVISYGEEKPADDMHNEAAWAKNRRVEIIYSAR